MTFTRVKLEDALLKNKPKSYKEKLKSVLRVSSLVTIMFILILTLTAFYDFKTQSNFGHKQGLCKIINNNVGVLYNTTNFATFTIHLKDNVPDIKHYTAIDNSGNILDYSYGIKGTINQVRFKGIQREDDYITLDSYYFNGERHFNVSKTPYNYFVLEILRLYTYNWRVFSKFKEEINPAPLEYGMYQVAKLTK